MGIIGKILGREKRSDGAVLVESVLPNGGLRREPMALSAVYRCVNVIADSVAVLPLNLYEWRGGVKRKVWQGDPMAQMLNYSPDGRMTRSTLMKMMVSAKLLNGNGYAYINRDEAVPRLEYIEPGRVSPIKQYDHRGNPYLIYVVTGFDRALQHDEMVHLLNFSYDGLVGVSTLAHARNTLRIAQGGESQASEFYEGSGQPSGVLSFAGRLNDEQKAQVYSEWNKRMRDGRGGMVALQGDQKYTPISINPADAQLLESRQFSVIEICRFFDVSPVKCFDLSKSSYSTVEATQLSFLTDTLAPILEAIELELSRKLWVGSDRGRYEVKFDTSVLLRADKTAQANYNRSMVMAGVMTPNEVRAQMDMDPVAGGDTAYMQINMGQLTDIGKGEQP